MPRFKNGLSRVGKVFHYCFRIDGKQFKGSTRATDRATAEQVLALKRKEALLGPQVLPNQMPTFKKLVASWLANHKGTFSQRHLEIVESCAKVWLTPAFGDLAVNQISTQQVLELRTNMLEAGRSPATVNLMLRNLKLLMSYATRLGHIPTLPFKVSPLKVQQEPRPTIPADRVGEFLRIIDGMTSDAQIRTMFRMLIGLGMRISEVCSARWEWVNPERKTYCVGKAKGKQARVLPIPDWVWSHLAQPGKRLSGWIFPNEDGDPHGRNFLIRYLQKAAQELKIQGLTQHRLRATFATLHAEAGTPVSEIQGMLGHKKITTTMIYVEQSLESKRKAQDALSQKLGLA